MDSNNLFTRGLLLRVYIPPNILDAAITLIYTANNTWSIGSPASTDNIFVAHLNAGNWQPVNGGVLPGNAGTGMTPVTKW